MITATTSTTQYITQQQTSTTQKTNNSNFKELLQSEQTLEAQKAKTAEVQFKNERMSFEFIKGLENVSEDEFDAIYSDLSEEEIGKIRSLSRLTNLSENETLNKVMFDKAKDMTPKEAGTYSFMKASEHFHFKHTGTANLSLAIPIMLEKYPNGVETPENTKLSHEEAFNMLIEMINSSKKGMETTEGELQEIHTKYFKEYNELLDMYNNEVRKNMPKSI